MNVTARLHIVPCGVACAMLLSALERHDSDFYGYLRWTVCFASIWVAIVSSRRNRTWAVPTFAVVAVMFNPLIPVQLTRGIWQPIDLGVALLFVVTAVILWQSRNSPTSNLPSPTPQALPKVRVRPQPIRITLAEPAMPDPVKKSSPDLADAGAAQSTPPLESAKETSRSEPSGIKGGVYMTIALFAVIGIPLWIGAEYTDHAKIPQPNLSPVSFIPGTYFGEGSCVVTREYRNLTLASESSVLHGSVFVRSDGLPVMFNENEPQVGAQGAVDLGAATLTLVVTRIEFRQGNLFVSCDASFSMDSTVVAQGPSVTRFTRLQDGGIARHTDAALLVLSNDDGLLKLIYDCDDSLQPFVLPLESVQSSLPPKPEGQPFVDEPLPPGFILTSEFPSVHLTPPPPHFIAPILSPDSGTRPQRPDQRDRPRRPERPQRPQRTGRPQRPGRPRIHHRISLPCTPEDHTPFAEAFPRSAGRIRGRVFGPVRRVVHLSS
ncbi:MAG: hypothetical protein HOP29_02170 [Phycisphaerales bacterium]|nr:hypothetical protein [Phycisphaerales bacterium]